MSSVLSVIKSLQEVKASDAPCKKVIQKMVYLIQEAGTNLGYDYSIHFYGPYSSDLDAEMRYLCSVGALAMDMTEYGHHISVDSSQNTDALTPDVLKLISAFSVKTPSELELITTALYVQRELAGASSESIVAGVTKIKGSKFPNVQINDAIDELRIQSYF